jgi:DNA-binding LytR/AlgR family response regulator
MENRIKIFIVEDEALIADEIRRTLEGLGYEICGISYEYASAAAAIPGSDADLFILDINLGGNGQQNGIALAGLIKSSNPKPFIFLTAYSDKDTIERATALHPANYLIKPVNPASLFAAIQLSLARNEKPAPPLLPGPDHEPPPYFYAKVGGRTTQLYWRDVFAMEASKNYVLVNSIAHDQTYPIRGSINFVLDKLVPESLQHQFFRLGRNLCLSRTHITSVDENQIICGGRSFENGGRLTKNQLALLTQSDPANDV